MSETYQQWWDSSGSRCFGTTAGGYRCKRRATLLTPYGRLCMQHLRKRNREHNAKKRASLK